MYHPATHYTHTHPCWVLAVCSTAGLHVMYADLSPPAARRKEKKKNTVRLHLISSKSSFSSLTLFTMSWSDTLLVKRAAFQLFLGTIIMGPIMHFSLLEYWTFGIFFFFPRLNKPSSLNICIYSSENPQAKGELRVQLRWNNAWGQCAQ